MRDRARVASDGQAEESLRPRISVRVFGPRQQGGSDIRTVSVGERAETKSRPVADLWVLVPGESNEGLARFWTEGLWADRGDREGNGQANSGRGMAG